MLFPVPSPFGLAGCAVPYPELTGACAWALGTGRSGAVWERRRAPAYRPLPAVLPAVLPPVAIAGSRPSGCRFFGAQIIALR